MPKGLLNSGGGGNVDSSARWRTGHLPTGKSKTYSEGRLLGASFLTVVLILTVVNAPAIAANRTDTTHLFCNESSSCASMVVGAGSFPGTTTTLLDVEPQYLLDRESGQGDASGSFALAASGYFIATMDGGRSGQTLDLIQWGGVATQAPAGQSGRAITTPIINLYQGTKIEDDNNHVVPEPGSMVLFLSGFLALGGYLRRGRKSGEIRSS